MKDEHPNNDNMSAKATPCASCQLEFVLSVTNKFTHIISLIKEVLSVEIQTWQFFAKFELFC